MTGSLFCKGQERLAVDSKGQEKLAVDSNKVIHAEGFENGKHITMELWHHAV